MALPYWGCGTRLTTRRRGREVTKPVVSQTQLERWAAAGNSPLDENDLVFWWVSQVSRRIFRVNLRGPPRKAKYYLATDSEQVP